MGSGVLLFRLANPACRSASAALVGERDLRRHHDRLGNDTFPGRRLVFGRQDAELMKLLLFGIAVWLVLEAAFSARFGVWFNVGVDAGVLTLFAVPLVASIRAARKQGDGQRGP